MIDEDLLINVRKLVELVCGMWGVYFSGNEAQSFYWLRYRWIRRDVIVYIFVH